MIDKNDRINVALLGTDKVGKSELSTAIIQPNNVVCHKQYYPTIGASYHYTAFSNGKGKLGIWDTAGQQRFRSSVPMYIKSSHIIFLLFDMTNHNSFSDLSAHMALIKNNAPKDVTIILVATHLDNKNQRIISEAQAQEFAEQQGIKNYFEISLKTRENFLGLYEHLINTAGSILDQNRLNQSRSRFAHPLQHIENFRELNRNFEGRVCDVIKEIADILKTGLEQSDPQTYFKTNEKALASFLSALKMTSKSVLNSALNVIAMSLAYCSVVGILTLWLIGRLAHNQKTKGSQFMFFAFGEKQQAQVLVHEVASEVAFRM
ncbi:MAG: hypothetical protein CK424_08825 [Legionella sp.]|nr:MAG: hypothetical protein CK424_08825 [Legionella sp.]